MAYQNVGTPRFYVNTLEWLMSNGIEIPFVMNGNPISVFNTLPVTPTSFYAAIDTMAGLPIDYSEKSFIAVLGHNIASSGNTYELRNLNDTAFAAEDIDPVIVNENGSPYDGFSIQTLDMTDASQFIFRILRDGNTQSTEVTVNIGSLIIGTYYDMPHSPDLNLTMTREYGGIKTIETKGGASLSNAFYTKPPAWGDYAGAWELYAGATTGVKKEFSRSGRRIWDLSFSYLDSSDLFPPTEHQGGTIQDTTPYPDGDVWGSGTWNEDQHILTHDSFYSQVIHKTNGGQLPFIFQPDKDNNNPDQFAIAKLDMKSFKFSQKSFNTYSISLKIREVW